MVYTKLYISFLFFWFVGILFGYGQTIPLPENKSSQGLIVWLNPKADPTEVFNQLDPPFKGSGSTWRFLGFGLYHVQTPPDAEQLILEQLANHPDIRYVGTNRTAELRNTKPNDPDYSKQWHHTVLGSEMAWDITTGGQTAGGHQIVIATLDSGFERDHEDIQPNLWINAGEIPGDGIDNDMNGHTDDYNGIFTKVDNGDIPIDSHGHSVIGYIAGKGNNGIGISGLSWNARLMLMGGTKSIQESDFITAFGYAYQWRKKFNETNGAEGVYIPAINISLGFVNVKPADLPWMCPLIDTLGQQGILVVAAAPNSGIDIETDGDMPCLCGSPNIICVTNTTQQDDLVSNAGFSKNYVHLSAPGYQSYTTRLTTNGLYGSFTGTSAATPMVTGAIGLLAAMPCDSMQATLYSNPASSALYLKNAILDGVFKIKDLEGITVTGGRLCLWCDEGIGAVQSLSNRCGSAEGPIDILLVSPNPANHYVRVDLRSPGSIGMPIRIFNMLGQIIWEKEYLTEAFEPKFIEIETTNWPAGVYIISAGNGQSRKSEVMVIHH